MHNGCKYSVGVNMAINVYIKGVRVYKCVYKYDGFTRTLRVDPQRCGRVPPSRDRETIGKGACREGEAVLVGVGHLRKKGGRKEAERVRIHPKNGFLYL